MSEAAELPQPDGPMLPDDPTLPEFWEMRYQSGHAGWDISRPAPPFVDLLSGPGAPTPGKLIALGCGRGQDAIFFARQGFHVTAVDFAPTPVRDTLEAARRASVKLEILQEDMFQLDAAHNGRYDYVLEHTCFSAIPPSERTDYAALIERLLRPGGLYIALFFAHGRPGGPPFDTNAREIYHLFGSRLVIESLGPPARSAEQRVGQEVFALMRKPLQPKEQAG